MKESQIIKTIDRLVSKGIIPLHEGEELKKDFLKTLFEVNAAFNELDTSYSRQQIKNAFQKTDPLNNCMAKYVIEINNKLKNRK